MGESKMPKPMSYPYILSCIRIRDKTRQRIVEPAARIRSQFFLKKKSYNFSKIWVYLIYCPLSNFFKNFMHILHITLQKKFFWIHRNRDTPCAWTKLDMFTSSSTKMALVSLFNLYPYDEVVDQLPTSTLTESMDESQELLIKMGPKLRL